MAALRISLIHSGRIEEGVADAILSPGHLLEQTATGVKKHATLGGYTERLVAMEDALQGKTVADAYAAADIVTQLVAAPGDVAQVILAATENVTKGERLISGGDGTLIAEASAASAGLVKQIVAYAEEALDLSATGAVDTLMAVRFV